MHNGHLQMLSQSPVFAIDFYYAPLLLNRYSCTCISILSLSLHCIFSIYYFHGRWCLFFFQGPVDSFCSPQAFCSCILSHCMVFWGSKNRIRCTSYIFISVSHLTYLTSFYPTLTSFDKHHIFTVWHCINITYSRNLASSFALSQYTYNHRFLLLI